MPSLESLEYYLEGKRLSFWLIVHFDSDGDFLGFMGGVSKTWFTAILVKTAVHRARYYLLRGRHQISA